MNLRELLQRVDVPSVVLSGITDDSRRVREGDVFVAVAGDTYDGHAFIADAVGRGAAAVLVETAPPQTFEVPIVTVDALAAKRGELAARYFDDPSDTIRCIGVTGTNGKTSVAHYLTDLLTLTGQKAGFIGTIGWGELRALEPSAMTTVGAIETQARLAAFKRANVGWAALEVSSHALAQNRVDAVRFETAVFTNLTRDHLDYHESETAYAAAKQRLFELPDVRRAVINTDDAFGMELARKFAGRLDILRLGADSDADVQIRDVSVHADGVSAQLLTPWGSAQVSLPFAGAFSLWNFASALAVVCQSGVPFDQVIEQQGRLSAVPGRMEFLRVADRPAVVIDYAHTPDAVEQALEALRAHCKGELVCVLGSGGDRDPGKRPLMARAAEALADVVWLTSDNPRTEDPEQIVADMRRGLEGGTCIYECIDRFDAIQRALICADSDDIVLIAGKGHEDYQELATGRVPFSDRAVALDVLEQRAVG